MSDRLNFHEYMLAIADEFKLSHAQMIVIRRKLTATYHGQFDGKPQSTVSLEALAQVIWNGLSDGQQVVPLLNADLVTMARRIEQQWSQEQAQ